MKFIARLLIATSLVSVAFGAANYKIPGFVIKPGAAANAPANNDKPFHAWTAQRNLATSDTGFLLASDTAHSVKFNTAEFNSFRNAMNVNANSGSNTWSGVVANNPDSVVCKAAFYSLGTDSTAGTFGILDSTSGLWHKNGGTATSWTAIDTDGLKFVRATIPWRSATAYKGFLAMSSASTDTIGFKFASCVDFYNH